MNDRPPDRSSGGYRSLLGNRTFRFLLLSQAVGDAGYAVYAIAILWLAYTISGSLTVAGLVLFVEFGIYSLSFLIGPFVDRARNLRTVLLLGYPAQALLAFLLGFLQYEGRLTVPLLLALVTALSFLWDFTWTANNLILPRVVPEADLFRANGLTGAVSGGNQIAGYAAGASLILLVGPGGGSFLYAALNLGAALLAIPVSAPSGGRPATRLWDEFVEGWRYLSAGLGRPRLQLVAYSTMEAFFSAAPALLITLFAAERFDNPARSYALLFTAFSVGGILGSLALGQLNPRRRLSTVLIAATISEGLLVGVAILAAPHLLESLVAWFFVGMVDIAFYTSFIVYFQATTPGPLLGRALTDAYFSRGASRAFGALAVGFLALALAPLTLGATVAVVYVAVGVAGPLLLPAVRRLGF